MNELGWLSSIRPVVGDDVLAEGTTQAKEGRRVGKPGVSRRWNRAHRGCLPWGSAPASTLGGGGYLGDARRAWKQQPPGILMAVLPELMAREGESE